MSALCHVWTAPGWQEESSRSRLWSVQPCVRPLGAVHMTAGHNALRGSGPGQFPAFENAMAQVGCPDRRIDRLCVTSPNLHITPDVGAISLSEAEYCTAANRKRARARVTQAGRRAGLALLIWIKVAQFDGCNKAKTPPKASTVRGRG
jgi:hypothetical protein